MKDSNNLVTEYIEQLTEKEKLSLEKAKEILGESFNITKSIGYTTWLSSKK